MEDNINMSLIGFYTQLCEMYGVGLYDLDLDNDINQDEVCDYFETSKETLRGFINDLKMEGF
jgi:hypothetical protein